MAVPLRGPLTVMLALRADDPIDLPHLHSLRDTAKPVLTASASSPSFACPAIPARERQLNMLRQRQRRLLPLDDLNNV